jgi:hypothetical protein
MTTEKPSLEGSHLIKYPRPRTLIIVQCLLGLSLVVHGHRREDD